MNALVVAFAILQAAGAVVGAGSAVWGEIAYLNALRDGVIDRAERRHLSAIGGGLKFGMTLLLAASLGLSYEAYIQGVVISPALTPTYWLFMCIALTVTFAAWALSRRKVSFALASSLVFSGWWFLLYLSFGLFPALSFGASVAVFVIATALFWAFLSGIRALVVP